MTAAVELDSAKDGTIKSITVYSGGKAEITRTFELDLNEGSNEIKISGLSSVVDTQSVRGALHGSSARVVDISCSVASTNVLEPWPSLRALLTKKKSLESEKLIRQQEANIYLSYAQNSKSEHIPVDKFVPFMETFVQQRTSISRTINALDDQILSVDQAIAKERDDKRTGSALGQVTIHLFVDSTSQRVTGFSGDASAEPNEDWKQKVREEIEAQLAPDINAVQQALANKLRLQGLADTERAQLEQEHDGMMQGYMTLAKSKYDERLMVEMARRASSTTREPGTTTAVLTLTYVVSNASWNPVYDLHATLQESGDASLIELDYRAAITQSSGEDWENAPLTLSTAPNRGQSVAVPELPRYCIKQRMPGFGQPPPVIVTQPPALQAFASGPAAQPSPFFGAARTTSLFGATQPPDAVTPSFFAAPLDPQPTAVLQSTSLPPQSVGQNEPGTIPLSESAARTLRTSPLSVSYAVNHAVKIPSDGAAHMVTVTTIEYEATLSRICIPRLEATVYLQSKVLNNSEYRLLAGAVSVFLNGTYVSQTSIKDVMPQESFQCVLGIDPGLRITYERVVASAAYVPFSAFAEQRRVTKHTARTFVTNNHAYSVRGLVVRDALPVASAQHNVKVLLKRPLALAEISTSDEVIVAPRINARWYKQETGPDGSDGKYEWLLEIDGGKGCTLEAEWEVSTPTNGFWEEVAESE